MYSNNNKKGKKCLNNGITDANIGAPLDSSMAHCHKKSGGSLDIQFGENTAYFRGLIIL